MRQRHHIPRRLHVLATLRLCLCVEQGAAWRGFRAIVPSRIWQFLATVEPRLFALAHVTPTGAHIVPLFIVDVEAIRGLQAQVLLHGSLQKGAQN